MCKLDYNDFFLFFNQYLACCTACVLSTMSNLSLFPLALQRLWAEFQICMLIFDVALISPYYFVIISCTLVRSKSTDFGWLLSLRSHVSQTIGLNRARIPSRFRRRHPQIRVLCPQWHLESME